MDGLEEKKRQPPRYPMGNVKQCKNTLARLTRDVLTKKLPANEARAAAYLISQQIQLFKIETPESVKQGLFLNIGAPDIEALESPEEREKRLDKLVEDHLAWKAAKEKAAEDTKRYNEEFVKRQVTSYVCPNGETVELRLPDFIIESEMENEIGLSKNRIIEKVAAMENPLESISESQPIESIPAQWKPSGIGVKRV